MNQINPDDILERYGGMVYQLALSQVKNPVDADDIFQEVFLRLVRTERKFENDEHIKAWLIRVTINRSRSFWRSAWMQKVVTIDEIPEEKNEASNIYEQVTALPQKYRTIIHLFYYEDMPLDKISRALGISYSSAAKRLSRARMLLKQQMIGVEDDEFSEQLPYRCKPTPNP